MREHPLCRIFPDMGEGEFGRLCADISKRGLLEAIWTKEGSILDGRHRFRACQRVGVAPRFREYTGTDPLGFVVAMNLQRRHLNESQRAMVAVAIANLPQGRPGKPANLPVSAVTQKQAADLLNVSARSVRSAVKVDKQAQPELADAVRQGKVSVSQASRLARESPDLQKAVVARVNSGKARTPAAAETQVRRERLVLPEASPMPLGVFTTIEADPPWELDGNESKSASTQYPTMDLTSIIALGAEVRERSAPNSHLYLWAINPMLEEAFRVMRAWGFAYKTCITWVKPQFGMGHYFRGATEQCLFGVRGTLPCLRADQPNWFQAPRGQHSKKPSEFYEMAASMSPGPRVRLFARDEIDGWSSWVNEVGNA